MLRVIAQARLHEKCSGQTLSHMVCNWQFAPNKATPGSTKVDFELEFSFSNSAHQTLTSVVFNEVCVCALHVLCMYACVRLCFLVRCVCVCMCMCVCVFVFVCVCVCVCVVFAFV